MTCTKQLWRTPGQILKSKDGNFFCNKACFMIWKNQHLLIGEKHGNWKGGHAAYRGIMFRAKIVPVCGECEIKDLRVLVVHHIDHNRSNNTLPNLRWLCRNCHYLVHNGKTF